MSHPSLFFVKYLLAESWGAGEAQSLTGINAVLRSLRLLPLSEQAYDEIVFNFEPPVGFDFDDRTHQPTRDFMRAEKITTLWDPRHRDDGRVVELLMPLWHVRNRVDVLLMGNSDAEFVARMAMQWAIGLPQVGIGDVITSRMIDIYRHFYMNPWTCDLQDWEDLLRGHPLEEAMLAALHGGPAVARYWVGLPLRYKNKKCPLEDALMAAHQRLLALRNKPTTKGVVDMQVKLSQTIDRLHERLHGNGADSATEQLMAFARRIKLVTQDPGIKSIHELVGANGSYSGDGKG